MLNLERGKVKDIIYEDDEIQIIEVQLMQSEKAVNYINLTGRVEIGNDIILNTISERLGLGSGGYHFVYQNLNNEGPKSEGGRESGHILKMKYTPCQVRFKTVEEYEDNREFFNDPVDLDKKPVVAATLHSMLAPIAASIKYRNRDAKIVCIYTYGGSMNASISHTLRELKDRGIIHSVVTCGECFGGDAEAINIYTALLYAYKRLECDTAIVTCGPGIAGTGSFFGFSTLEMIMPLYAAHNLNLTPILSPRISFADKRERHLGISLQSISIMKLINFKTIVPILNSDKIGFLKDQFLSSGIKNCVSPRIIDRVDTKEALECFNLDVSVMGRGYDQDKYYFDNCGAVGSYCCDFLEGTGR